MCPLTVTVIRHSADAPEGPLMEWSGRAPVPPVSALYMLKQVPPRFIAAVAPPAVSEPGQTSLPLPIERYPLARWCALPTFEMARPLSCALRIGGRMVVAASSLTAPLLMRRKPKTLRMIMMMCFFQSLSTTIKLRLFAVSRARTDLSCKDLLVRVRRTRSPT